MNSIKDLPTLYDVSGDIKDINTILIPRGTLGSLRAELDRLRIECGDEPIGGWDEWAKHQRPVSPEHEAEVDAALGIVRKRLAAIPTQPSAPIK